jgi:ATP/maltotriose-dependent transcriptional regulator MalT
VEGLLLSSLAVFKAWVGLFDEAVDLLERSRARLLEMGDDVAVATQWTWYAADVAVLARDPRRVREIVEPVLASVEPGRDLTHRTHLLALLAEAAWLEGDGARTRDLAEQARAIASRTDLYQALGWRLPLVRALLDCGDFQEAERLADEAVTIIEPTDNLLVRGKARLARADVLAATGRTEAAIGEVEKAVALLEAKGATLFVERAHEQLAGIRGGEPGDRAPLGRG